MFEEFTFDETAMNNIAKIVKAEMERNYTVEEAIANKKSQDEITKNVFANLFLIYNTIEKSRKDTIKEINITKLKIILGNFLVMVFRDDVYEEIEKLFIFMNESKKDLKKEKELLIKIRNAIIRLENVLAVECNMNLAILLAGINDKNIAINEELYENVVASLSRTRGINTQTTDKHREKIEECNQVIDVYSKKLFK